MNNEQIAQTVVIVSDEAVNFLAQKHGQTREAVIDALNAGHVKLTEQFFTLLDVGMKQAAAIRSKAK